jgi:hypothetical protein
LQTQLNSIYENTSGSSYKAGSDIKIETLFNSIVQNHSASLNKVIYKNGMFVAVGAAGGYLGTIITSSDGINWEEQDPSLILTLLKTLTLTQL